MKIIHRYILNNFIKYLIFVLSTLVFIYIVINLFDNLGKFLAKNVLAQDIAIYYLYLIPSYIVLLIPVAAIMAIFLIFGFMTKHKELIALKSSGLNINRLFVLILITGVVLSIGTFAFQETVGVWVQTKMFEHKQAKIDKRPQRQKTRRSNFFYNGEDNWIYFIRRFDGVRQKVDGIILWQIAEKNRIRKRIDAEEGIYDTVWKFSNATVREFDTLGNELINTYPYLEMPELKERPDDFLRRMRPLEEMNFLEISSFVERKARAGEDVAKEEVELNYRFSYPVITVLVLLITLPLAVVLKKGGIAVGMGISIVLAFVYWGVIQSCRAYGVAGIMDPVLAAWLPNILFGVVGIILVAKVPR